MTAHRLALQATLNALPPDWPDDPLPAIQAALQAAPHKVVVLDDDPTGTQSVHGVPVLTEWPVDLLRADLSNDLSAFYVLTNSRSLQPDDAHALNAEIGRNLAEAARQTKRRFVVVSRGDSTLRGHFPGEVQALADALGQDFDAWLLIPMLREAGRYTINDVHYVADGNWLIPAGDSDYARDATFGYRASNLRDWVAEKTQGRIRAADVTSVSLDDIRRGGPARVTQRLMSLEHGSVCVINAVSTRDLEVFTQGLLAAEAQDRRFLYRTAPSFVPVRAGIAPYSLLQPADLQLPRSSGGLIVVGSYVPKTSGQVGALLDRGEVTSVEINVEAVLKDDDRAGEIERVAAEADRALQADRDVVIYTSRRLITGTDAAHSLSIGQQISAGLIAILQRMTTRPRYVLAKGGITSSDVATKGLGVKRAMVLGQIVPGVSVWQLGPESRYKGLAYIVFPGNVGGPQTLAEVVSKLKIATQEN